MLHLEERIFLNELENYYNYLFYRLKTNNCNISENPSNKIANEAYKNLLLEIELIENLRFFYRNN